MVAQSTNSLLEDSGHDFKVRPVGYRRSLSSHVPDMGRVQVEGGESK